MDDSKQRKLGAVLSYAVIIISTIVQLIYTPFLTRMLGQSEYGLYSLIASIIGYLTVLDLGFGNAIVVYTAKYRANKEFEKEKKMQGMFKIIFYVLGIIVMLIGIILYFNIDLLFKKTMTQYELNKAKIMMLILAFNLIITFSFNIYSSIINAYEKFTFQKLMSIANTLLKPLLMIPLLFLGFKSITMCLVITIINIMVMLSNYFYCKNNLKIKVKFNGLDKKLFFEMFSYSFFIFLGTIVDKVNWSVDQFILGAVSGTIEVSIYSIASIFNTLFMNLSSCCCQIMLPKLSKMEAKKVSNETFSSEFVKFGRLQWYIISLVMTGIIIFGKEFINIWAGSDFNKSYYVMLILVIPVSFVLIENIGVYIMQAKNLHKTKTIITSIAAFVNIIISIPLAGKLGSIGSAIGTGLSLIVCNLIIINIYYHKVVKLNVLKFWKNIFKISLPIIPIFVLTFFINKFVINADSLIKIGITATIYTIIYFTTCYLVSFNDYEKNIVEGIINKLKRIVKKNGFNN